MVHSVLLTLKEAWSLEGRQMCSQPQLKRRHLQNDMGTYEQRKFIGENIFGGRNRNPTQLIFNNLKIYYCM